jgi:protein CpxP
MSNWKLKPLALAALIGLLLAAPTGVTWSQPLLLQPGQSAGGRMGGPTLEVLTTRLKLTDDQQAKLKPILAERDDKMKALRANESIEMQDRRAAMMKMRTEVDDKIAAVLTEDQKAEYAKLNEEIRQRRGQGGPPPAQ